MCRTCRVIIRHNRFYHCSYFFYNSKTLRELTVSITESAWKVIAVAEQLRTREKLLKLSVARHGLVGEDGDKGNDESEYCNLEGRVDGWIDTSNPYITSHHTTLHYTTRHNITPHRTTSYHITPHHITSHHITSHHITSHHITSHHITSHRITSHHTTPHHTTPHEYQYLRAASAFITGGFPPPTDDPPSPVAHSTASTHKCLVNSELKTVYKNN